MAPEFVFMLRERTREAFTVAKMAARLRQPAAHVEAVTRLRDVILLGAPHRIRRRVRP